MELTEGEAQFSFEFLKFIPLPSKITRISTILLSAEIYVVAGLVGGAFIVPRLSPGAALAELGFTLIRLLTKRRFTRRTPADFGVFLLFLIVPLAIWATALPEITVPQVWRLLGGVAVFYAIVNWCSNSWRLQWVMIAFALAGVGLAGFALIGVHNWKVNRFAFIPSGIYDRMTVLVSDSAHPNVLAGSLLLLAVLVLSVFLFSSGTRLTSLTLGYGIALLPMLAILVLTQARAAWLAFVLVSALLVLLRWRYGWLIVVAAVLIVGVGIAIVGLPQFVDLISSSGSIEGIDERIEIWSRAILMIQDFPFTGIGMGSFGPVTDTLYPFFLIAPNKIVHAHNMFLQVAVDLGIPGLIAWLSIYFTIIVIGWQVYRKGRSLDNLHIAGLGAAVLAVQLAMGVQGMLDAVVWGMVRPAPLVWALWGFAVAAGRLYLNPAPTLKSDLPALVGN